MHTRAVIVTRRGGPEVLEVREEELSDPGPGMVQVRVHACALSFADILIREGTYPGAPVPPFTSGYDFVGFVERVGEGVEAVKAGDLVAAVTVTGAYGEYRTCLAHDLVVLPAGLDPVAASCLVLNYMTAYQMLHQTAQVKPVERILIHGASGTRDLGALSAVCLQEISNFSTELDGMSMPTVLQSCLTEHSVDLKQAVSR